MDIHEKVQHFEDDSKTLENIANQFGQGSKEYATLKRAAIALWYVLTEDHERFRQYVDKFEGDLTPEQRARLVAMGIDPDRDPDGGGASG
jgi:tryptophanyl-tRNA synthetase